MRLTYAKYEKYAKYTKYAKYACTYRHQPISFLSEKLVFFKVHSHINDDDDDDDDVTGRADTSVYSGNFVSQLELTRLISETNFVASSVYSKQ